MNRRSEDAIFLRVRELAGSSDSKKERRKIAEACSTRSRKHLLWLGFKTCSAAGGFTSLRNAKTHAFDD